MSGQTRVPSKTLEGIAKTPTPNSTEPVPDVAIIAAWSVSRGSSLTTNVAPIRRSGTSARISAELSNYKRGSA